MQHIIRQYYGDAREIIPLLEKKYDFIFIDGLKKASLDFFILSWDKLKIGGIIVIDDVVKFRHKMENLYTYLDEKTINYEIVMVDPDDGIMLIQK
jgi:predicted O-methyltransferase YrrM